jgi:hypothetical protein
MASVLFIVIIGKGNQSTLKVTAYATVRSDFCVMSIEQSSWKVNSQRPRPQVVFCNILAAWGEEYKTSAPKIDKKYL